jgi:hypothetical protein
MVMIIFVASGVNDFLGIYGRISHKGVALLVPSEMRCRHLTL